MFADTLRSARYLAFGGCGTKGVAYMGCLRAVQQHAGHAEWHRQLRGTCGSSSGCLAALAFLVDADADTLVERWRALHIESVVPYVDLNAIFARYGVDEGEEVRRIIREVFAACGIDHATTFRTLHRLTGRDLRICVTNLNRRRLEIFSHLTAPDVVVADAIYWSMSVPFVFQPETYRGDLMVDGCVLAYVPHDVWPLEDTVVFHASGVGTGLRDEVRREVPDLRSFAAGVMACCAQSVQEAVRERARAHPERFVRVSVHEAARDATLTLDAATMEGLVNLGFATVLFRLRPELALAFDRLLRLATSVAMAAATSAATAAREEECVTDVV